MTRAALDVVLAEGSPSVSREISPEDVMYKTDPDRYFHLGREAVLCIDLLLTSAKAPTPERILDLPSGHGRVLRVLRAVFPQAEVVACDLDRSGVDFCAGVLGATPCYSNVDPGRVNLPGQFDLIWCGSLFTHLDQPRWSEFLSLFGSALSLGGVFAFTTHGPFLVEELRRGERSFPVRSVADLVKGFDYEGFAYQDYRGQEEYGISLSSPAWVARSIEREPGLVLDTYLARGWAGRQDAYGCVIA